MEQNKELHDQAVQPPSDPAESASAQDPVSDKLSADSGAARATPRSRGWTQVAIGTVIALALGAIAFALLEPRDDAWLKCDQAKAATPETTIRFCGAVITQATQSPDNLAIAHRKRAQAFLNIGEIASAEQDFTAALATQKTDASLYAQRGAARARNGLPDAAIEDFNSAIALEPRSHELFVSRGNAELASNQNEKALASFSQALAINPTAAEAVYRRALANARLDRIADAAEDYSRAIELSPKNASYWNARCWFRGTMMIDLDLALGDCDEAIRLKPSFVPAMDSRAFVLLRLGRLEDAKAAYDKAIAAETRYAWPYFGRGIAKKRLGDTAGAELDFAAARERQPDIDADYAAYGETP